MRTNLRLSTRLSPLLLALALFPPSLLVGACSSKGGGNGDGSPVPDMAAPENLKFPTGFLFGTAIAGFQAEMGCPTIAAAQCEDPASDWYEYITDPNFLNDTGVYLEGDPPSAGPGFFELYPQDLDRAQNELKHNALRTSIEWSRLFPTSTIGVTDPTAVKALASPDAVAYYHALFASMKAHGLTPLVTLNHYTLPNWISDAWPCHMDITTCAANGWVDQDRIVTEIVKYATFVGQEFGGDVDMWATLNEPLTAVVLPAFIFQSPTRTNPPAVTLKYTQAKAAMNAMIVAHARMYDAVHAADTVDADGDGKAARVGLVYNLEAVAPNEANNSGDVLAAKNAAYLVNALFLNATINGDLDANLDGTTVHRDDLAGRMDFLGINYYARILPQGTPTSFLPQLSSLLDFDVLNLTYDYAYPKGIYEVLTFANQYKVPLLISETGVEDHLDTGLASAWVVETLHWVKRAINEGVPVEGYFYWTLMDNYEWNHGMSIRMGLYGVDSKDPTKARTARSVVGVYAQIAGSGEIPASLAAAHPIDN